MRLVDDDRVVAPQQPVALDLGQQQAVGHQPQQRVLARAVAEAHRVADRLAQRHVQLLRDPLRHRPRRQPPRLRVRDRAAHAAPQLQADLGQLRRLARAGLAGDDHDLVIADRGQQVLAPRRHGQRLGVGDGGHRGAPARDPLLRARDVALEPLAPSGVPPLEPLQPAAEAVLVLQRQLGEARPQRVTGAGAGHPFQVSAAAVPLEALEPLDTRPQRRMRRRQPERGAPRPSAADGTRRARPPRAGRPSASPPGRRRPSSAPRRAPPGCRSGPPLRRRRRTRGSATARACPACPVQPIAIASSPPSISGQPWQVRRAPPCSSASPGPPTTVITAASWLTTCASSCAITASSSRGSSRSSRPLRQVQPVAAADGALDPAVGQRLALEHDRRLRQVGDDAQPLDDRVQLGRVGDREARAARGDRDPVTGDRRRPRRRARSRASPAPASMVTVVSTQNSAPNTTSGVSNATRTIRTTRPKSLIPPSIARQRVPRPLRAWKSRARAT